VLDPAVEDFKNSARRFMERADAVLLPEAAVWQSSKPVFRMAPPEYVTRQVVMFVSELMGRGAIAGVE